MTKYVAVYINAGNDRNGNPRRGWIVIDTSDGGLAFVDEGYRGRSALHRTFPDTQEVIAIDVTPGAYRDLLHSTLLRKNPRPRRTRRRMGLIRDVRFFREHAGGVVGRATAGALDLARAEREMRQRGWAVEWVSDEDPDLSWMSEEELRKPHEVYCAILYQREPGIAGRPPRSLASLCGIVDPSNEYMRVVEAELAAEALANA